jgi:uncharacterized SAM-binding protein YcdF (DUF218 family)
MVARQQSETWTGGARKRLPWLRLLLLAFAVVLLAYGIGFAFFLANLPAPYEGAAKADAIVALTGQGGRLAPAVSLLEKGDGQRLLITGVNRLTSKRDLKAVLHGGDAFDCCVDLGFAALDTRGNAQEAARWVRANHYQSLIVVTADYHMPRSLIEFSAQMPEVRMVPYPVAFDGPRPMSWDAIKRLNGEYVKYVASLVRAAVADAFLRAYA